MISLGEKTNKNNKAVISSKHVADLLGKESPGVGSYDADSKVSSTFHMRSASIGQCIKFYENKGSLKLKSNLPISYVDREYKSNWGRGPGGFS